MKLNALNVIIKKLTNKKKCNRNDQNKAIK